MQTDPGLKLKEPAGPWQFKGCCVKPNCRLGQGKWCSRRKREKPCQKGKQLCPEDSKSNAATGDSAEEKGNLKGCRGRVWGQSAEMRSKVQIDGTQREEEKRNRPRGLEENLGP